MLPRATPSPAVILAAPKPRPLRRFPPGQNQPQKFLGSLLSPAFFNKPARRAGTVLPARLLRSDSHNTLPERVGRHEPPRLCTAPKHLHPQVLHLLYPTIKSSLGAPRRIPEAQKRQRGAKSCWGLLSEGGTVQSPPARVLPALQPGHLHPETCLLPLAPPPLPGGFQLGQGCCQLGRGLRTPKDAAGLPGAPRALRHARVLHAHPPTPPPPPPAPHPSRSPPRRSHRCRGRGERGGRSRGLAAAAGFVSGASPHSKRGRTSRKLHHGGPASPRPARRHRGGAGTGHRAAAGRGEAVPGWGGGGQRCPHRTGRTVPASHPGPVPPRPAHRIPGRVSSPHPSRSCPPPPPPQPPSAEGMLPGPPAAAHPRGESGLSRTQPPSSAGTGSRE